jgi:hypothetical protein
MEGIKKPVLSLKVLERAVHKNLSTAAFKINVVDDSSTLLSVVLLEC